MYFASSGANSAQQLRIERSEFLRAALPSEQNTDRISVSGLTAQESMQLAMHAIERALEIRYDVWAKGSTDATDAKLLPEYGGIYGLIYDGLEAARKRGESGRRSEEWNAWNAARQLVPHGLAVPYRVDYSTMAVPIRPDVLLSNEAKLLGNRLEALRNLAAFESLSRETYEGTVAPAYKEALADVSRIWNSEHRQGADAEALGRVKALIAELSPLVNNSPHSQAEKARGSAPQKEIAGEPDSGWMKYM